MNDFDPSQKKSTPDYIRHFLKNPPLLLQNFHYEDKMEFLKIGSIHDYNNEEVVVEENKQVDSAYLVTRGKVGIWKENIQLTSLGEGDFIGEAFLFSPNSRMAKVISEGDSQLLNFKRYDTLNFFRKRPEKLFNIFTRNIIEIQQAKITETNNQLMQTKKQLMEKLN